VIVRPRGEWNGGLPPAELLYSCVMEHEQEKQRLRKLRDYYEGRHSVSARSRMSGMPNNALVHGFPRYICIMTSGYLIGAPIRYRAEGQEEQLEALKAVFAGTEIDSVDAELARNAAVFGKCVELVFAGADGRPRSVAISPEKAFVVYSDDVEQAPMLGVYGVQLMRSDGSSMGYRFDVYTDRCVMSYRMKNVCREGFAKPEKVEKHYFGMLPMVEYWNGDDETGDFENAISLIDAYDLLQSDRLNDKQQFVDALLVLYGCTLETDEMGRSPGRQLREDKAIVLPDGDARAEWLCKQLNETDTEVLKCALNADIHKMCMVPDMTDANFAGNSSGVAMRYKLLGLEQLTRIKERWFREGLRQRLKLYARYLMLLGKSELDTSGVSIHFVRSLPSNELEVAQTVKELDGLVDKDKLREKAEQAMGF